MEAPTSVRQSIESATCRRSSSASLRWASSPRSGAAGPSLPGATAPFQVKTPARAFAPVTARAGVQEAPCRFRINRSRTGRFPWVPAIWTFYFLAFCSRRYSCSIHRKSPAVGGCVMLLWAIFEKYPGFASHAFAMDVRMLRSTLVRVLPQRAAAAGYRPSSLSMILHISFICKISQNYITIYSVPFHKQEKNRQKSRIKAENR